MNKLYLSDKREACRLADYLLDNGVDVAEVRLRTKDAVIYYTADYNTIEQLVKKYRDSHDTAEEQ